MTTIMEQEFTLALVLAVEGDLVKLGALLNGPGFVFPPNTERIVCEAIMEASASVPNVLQMLLAKNMPVYPSLMMTAAAVDGGDVARHLTVLAVMKVLLETEDVDFADRDEEGNTILHIATFNLPEEPGGSIDRLKLLVDACVAQQAQEGNMRDIINMINEGATPMDVMTGWYRWHRENAENKVRGEKAMEYLAAHGARTEENLNLPPPGVQPPGVQQVAQPPGVAQRLDFGDAPARPVLRGELDVKPASPVVIRQTLMANMFPPPEVLPHVETVIDSIMFEEVPIKDYLFNAQGKGLVFRTGAGADAKQYMVDVPRFVGDVSEGQLTFYECTGPHIMTDARFGTFEYSDIYAEQFVRIDAGSPHYVPRAMLDKQLFTFPFHPMWRLEKTDRVLPHAASRSAVIAQGPVQSADHCQDGTALTVSRIVAYTSSDKEAAAPEQAYVAPQRVYIMRGFPDSVPARPTERTEMNIADNKNVGAIKAAYAAEKGLDASRIKFIVPNPAPTGAEGGDKIVLADTDSVRPGMMISMIYAAEGGRRRTYRRRQVRRRRTGKTNQKHKTPKTNQKHKPPK